MDSFIYPYMGPMSHIPNEQFDALYLGNLNNAEELLASEHKGMWAILNCTDDPMLDVYWDNPKFIIRRLNQKDGLPYPAAQITEGTTFIRTNLFLGNSVLVCCHAGISRSPGMILAYLLSEGFSYNESIRKIRKSRPVIQIHPKIDLSIRQYFNLAPRTVADLIP